MKRKNYFLNKNYLELKENIEYIKLYRKIIFYHLIQKK